ncbi:MAG: putative maltokinase [Nitrospirota bacterium]
MTKIRYTELQGKFGDAFCGKSKTILEKEILPQYLPACRWFAGKLRKINELEILEDILFNSITSVAHLLMIRVSYSDGLPEIYMLPISFTPAPDTVSENYPFAVIAKIKLGSEEGIFFDATYDDSFRGALLLLIIRGESLNGLNGQLIAAYERRTKHNDQTYDNIKSSQVIKADQSNTSVLYEDKLILKLFRKLGEGINPDIEMVRFIYENASSHDEDIPLCMGFIEYRRANHPEPIFLGNLQRYVQNEGDAWSFTIGNITKYYENILYSGSSAGEIITINKCMFDVYLETIPDILIKFIGIRYIEMAAQLGKTTGQLHLILASHKNNPDFTPEPFGTLYQQSLYQSMQNTTKSHFKLLRKSLKLLPDAVKEDALYVLSNEREVLRVFKSVVDLKLTATRIRIHGDYHLGQVLCRGNDCVVIDFEGEPLLTLSERRLKRSPLRDVASMIRSFHYAPFSVLSKRTVFTQKNIMELMPWADLWYFYISGIFLSSYMDKVKSAEFMSVERAETESLLRIFLLEKAVYELGYELSNRPEWVSVPLKGIASLLHLNET